MAVDPENAHIHEAPYHGAALAERADPQLLPKPHAELAGRALARPVLLDFDGKGRKPRIRPAILEVDGPCAVRQILDVEHTDGIIHVQQPEHIDGDRAQLDDVEGNHRSALLSPCRTVTNVRSRYSSSGTTTRRLLPSDCRSSLTVAGPCFARKALTCAIACPTAAALKTSSVLISMTSPLSIRNLSARCDDASGVSSLRDGGSSGWADSARRTVSPAARSGSGSWARCDAR